MSQENVDALRAVYEKWANGNFRAVDLYDPNVLFISDANDPVAGRYLGAEGVKEFMRGWLEAWTSVTIAAEEMIEADNSVVVRLIPSVRDGRTPRWPAGGSFCEVRIRGSPGYQGAKSVQN